MNPLRQNVLCKELVTWSKPIQSSRLRLLAKKARQAEQSIVSIASTPAFVFVNATDADSVRAVTIVLDS